jgi:hypothetical protein
MRMHRLLVLAMFVAVAVTGCATDPAPEHPRVRVGMSREDVRFYFGEPLRIEATPWGEDWYYRCLYWSNPQVGGEVVQNAYDGSGAVSVSVSSPPGNKGECPIHLSADGHVIEPLPEGKILGR